MRKFLFLAAAAVLGAAAIGLSSPLQAQPYYGGMMGGYGGGYGPGYGMGYGMMGGYGYGPGMMYGYAPNGGRYYGRRYRTYRGKRLCWHQTGGDRESGYYRACSQ